MGRAPGAAKVETLNRSMGFLPVRGLPVIDLAVVAIYSQEKRDVDSETT